MIKFLTNQKPGFVLPKIKAQRSKKRNVVGAAGIGLPLCPCTGLQWEKKKILALNRMRQRWSE